MVDENGLLDVSKLSRKTAIKAVKLLFKCTEQEAMQFVDLAQGRTSGDLVGGTNEKEPSARRTKEEGRGQEEFELFADGEEHAGSGHADDAGAGET